MGSGCGMPAIDRTAELAEYEAVLSSSLFAGQTNSNRFLRYVCDKFFAGVDHLGEVDVAVEALGRRADFDPQQDSIVRVEAHRVRRRLHDYYASEGASHPIRLVLPQGSYLPQFVSAQEERAAAGSLARGTAAKSAESPPLSLPKPVPIGKSVIGLLALLVVGLIVGGVVFNRHIRAKKQALPTAASTLPVPGAGAASARSPDHGWLISEELHRSVGAYLDGRSIFRWRRALACPLSSHFENQRSATVPFGPARSGVWLRHSAQAWGL